MPVIIDERMLTGLVDEAMTARYRHVFIDVRTCTRGFQPATQEDWDRHQMEEALVVALNSMTGWQVRRG